MNNSLRCSQTGPISDKILLEYRQFANTPPDERTAKKRRGVGSGRLLFLERLFAVIAAMLEDDNKRFLI